MSILKTFPCHFWHVYLLFFFLFHVQYSTLLHLPPLRFHCVVGCRYMNPGLLQCLHWQPDAPTYRPDLIHLGHISSTSARSHLQLGHISSTSARSDPQLGQISSTSARSHPRRPDLIYLGWISSHHNGQISFTSARNHPHRPDLIHVGQISSTSARSHPRLSQISSTTRPDLIHNSQMSSITRPALPVKLSVFLPWWDDKSWKCLC